MNLSMIQVINFNNFNNHILNELQKIIKKVKYKGYYNRHHIIVLYHIDHKLDYVNVQVLPIIFDEFN